MKIFTKIGLTTLACICASNTHTEMKKETLKYENLKKGERFTVKLPANPSTGFVWSMLVNQPPKKRFIELVKSEFIPSKVPGTGANVPPEERRAGAGGEIEFTFKAVKETGQTTYAVPLYYGRPQSGEVSKIVALAVKIRK